VEWLKVYALTSNPRTTKKKKKVQRRALKMAEKKPDSSEFSRTEDMRSQI
jgi:hypothetical protein